MRNTFTQGNSLYESPTLEVKYLPEEDVIRTSEPTSGFEGGAEYPDWGI